MVVLDEGCKRSSLFGAVQKDAAQFPCSDKHLSWTFSFMEGSYY